MYMLILARGGGEHVYVNFGSGGGEHVYVNFGSGGGACIC